MERFDAAVIGAGPEGLIAAHRLALAGLKVIVLERGLAAGGRATTREFHPGFRASPFADELPPLPRHLIAGLELARHGAILMPAPASGCLTGGRLSVLYNDPALLERTVPTTAAAGIASLRSEIANLHLALAERGRKLAPKARRLAFWRPTPARLPWPGEEFGAHSLAEALAERIPDSELRLHLAADATSGRSMSPFVAGTALALLGAGGSGMPAGGLGTLGAALLKAAAEAGATIRYGAEVREVNLQAGRVVAITLVGGERIDLGAVISSLDVKKTFLGLMDWSALPGGPPRRVARFRMGGGRARILFALDRMPQILPELQDAARGPIHVVESLPMMAEAHDAWRAGIVFDRLPTTLRFPTLTDPRLAPIGKATMTATLSCVPLHLVGGHWDSENRLRLIARVLAAAEKIAPGIVASVVGVRAILPADIERDLGISDGDLDGGEITPDQALGFRPMQHWQDGRTVITGLYLGGPSAAPSPFLTGVSGDHAAMALLADGGSRP